MSTVSSVECFNLFQKQSEILNQNWQMYSAAVLTFLAFLAALKIRRGNAELFHTIAGGYTFFAIGTGLVLYRGEQFLSDIGAECNRLNSFVQVSFLQPNYILLFLAVINFSVLAVLYYFYHVKQGSSSSIAGGELPR
ncbi:hypothetical protein [Chromobacterium subtsugae]|uniref:hypothetical protein n=1 Tax=Chromobacterium subtsugae TaxID=251747 RepID=UPI000AC9AA95|nr:hypothetical protein [Chromobacterium subtsugae]